MWNSLSSQKQHTNRTRLSSWSTSRGTSSTRPTSGALFPIGWPNPHLPKSKRPSKSKQESRNKVKKVTSWNRQHNQMNSLTRTRRCGCPISLLASITQIHWPGHPSRSRKRNLRQFNERKKNPWLLKWTIKLKWPKQARWPSAIRRGSSFQLICLHQIITMILTEKTESSLIIILCSFRITTKTIIM